MSTEQRTIRPFAGLEQFERAMGAVRLRVGEDEVEPNGKVVITEDAFRLRAVALRLASNEDERQEWIEALLAATETIGLSTEDLELIVIGTSSYLKFSDILYRLPFDSLRMIDRLVDLSGNPRRRVFRTPYSGVKVEAAISLTRSIEPKPLRPWRRGTWLARAEFRVATDLAPAGFTPRPLTDDARQQLGLPASAMRYVRIPDEYSPLSDDSAEDMVEMWVDADLLSRMSVGANSPGARVLQLQLFVDALAAIVDAAHKHREQLDSADFLDLQSTLLGRAIAAVARRGGSAADRIGRCSQLLEICRTDLPRFLAFAEDAIGMTKAANALLEDS